MRAYFVATGCLRIVLGEDVCPPDTGTWNGRAYQTWLEKDGKAQCALLGSCTPPTALHIENLRTSSDMRKALAGVANSAETETGRSLLHRRLTNIKAIPGDPLSDFFGKLQETVGLLAGTDHAIPPHQHRTRTQSDARPTPPIPCMSAGRAHPSCWSWLLRTRARVGGGVLRVWQGLRAGRRR